MEFSYSASTAEGSLIKGVVEAESELAAEENLWRSGLTIIDLKRSIHLPPLDAMLPSLFGVKRRDLILFSRNIATLLEAGIPIMRALVLSSRFGRRSMRHILQDIARELEKGSRFSEACAKYPAVFPQFYVYLIRTGE
jgi:type IV pilus assembly protein PilC